MKSKPPNKKARLDTSTSEQSSKKEKDSSSNSGKSAGNASAGSESSGTPVASVGAVCLPTYPTMYMPDLLNSKDYSRIGQILSSGAGGRDNRPFEMLTMEDVDLLQMELESLWSNISVRMRTLRREQGALSNSSNAVHNPVAALGDHYDPQHQEKINAVATLIDAGHGTRTSVSAAAKLVMGSQTSSPAQPPSSPASTSSRKSTASSAASSAKDRQPKKKVKGEVESKGKKASEKQARAVQNKSHALQLDDSALFDQKAPNQFWDFADAYCREVNKEDLELLKKTTEEYSFFPDTIFNVPPLGKHYLRPDEPTVQTTGLESKSPDVCGPLTQRLVAALVEERVSGFNANNGSTKADTDSQSYFITRPGLVKALGLDDGLSAGGPALESRLRQVLMEQGLLVADCAEDSSLINPNDEILADIRNTQNTLRGLHCHNANKLRDLEVLATREIMRSDLRKDLEKADREVLEAFKLISSCRLKKKPPTKKEKETATKALSNRTGILQKLQDQPHENSPVSPAVSSPVPT